MTCLLHVCDVSDVGSITELLTADLECLNVQMYGCTSVRVYECTGVRVYGCSHCTPVPMFGCTDGCVDS